MTPEHHGRLRQRCGDVVAVADERDRAPRQLAQALLQRQAVGQRLARMLLVGERVDDPEARGGDGERLEARLGVGADDGAVDPAFQIPRDVGDRLARAEGFLARWLDHVAAELADRDLEGRTRPQRRLLEQQRDVLAFERLLVRARPLHGPP